MADKVALLGETTEHLGHDQLAREPPASGHAGSDDLPGAERPPVAQPAQLWSHQELPVASRQDIFTSQPEMTQPPRMAPLDLSPMLHALPQQPYRGQHQNHGGHDSQRYHARTMASPGGTALSPAAPFGLSVPTAGVPNPPYYMPQHVHMPPHFYQAPLASQPAGSLPSRAGFYYPSPVLTSQPVLQGMPYYYTTAPPFPALGPPGEAHPSMAPYGVADFQLPPDSRARQPQQWSREVHMAPPPRPRQDNAVTAESRQGIVRGPPMKPRQSGHAIWIGNLPPQTDLMNLVHHVCKETEGLESLFLIPKSNCAFANFKDEASCSAAQRKLHDSRFMAVRLASRLRKNTVEGPAGVTAPTGPAASAPAAGAAQAPTATEGDETDHQENGASESKPAPVVLEARERPTDGVSPHKDRFFILKSLTIEDLELSVRNSTWATQAHNEDRLNSAFQTSDNVYLLFSANKSGEYFGYARMVSPINEDPAAAVEFAPSVREFTSELDLPRVIPTEPTEFAPKGRIIDDSARGTIFWEADRGDRNAEAAQDDEGSGDSVVGGDTGSVPSSQEGSGAESQAWGRPFRLQWLSTTRLPFHRTRGMRTPWNSNREVKIARDGTELEPSVGRRLIGLFNRPQAPPMAMVPSGPLGVTVYSPVRSQF